jgi:hypothetical protein
MAKKTKVILIVVVFIGLLGAAGVAFFFANLYQKDMRALTGFVDSYETYEKAVSSLKNAPSKSITLQTGADQALADLQAKAAARISSLIKNEKEVMRTTQNIAELSAKELAALRAYQKAAEAQSSVPDQLANALNTLSTQRQAAYAHFRELGQ